VVPAVFLAVGFVVMVYGAAAPFCWHPNCGPSDWMSGCPDQSTLCVNPAVYVGWLLMIAAVPAIVFVILFHRSPPYASTTRYDPARQQRLRGRHAGVEEPVPPVPPPGP
jgi:hypothetical protein